MVSEVTAAPISTSATPFSFSASVSTARPVAVGRKSFLAGATPALLSMMSRLSTAEDLPMKILKLPSMLSDVTPMTSFSLAHTRSSSAEKLWATAP